MEYYIFVVADVWFSMLAWYGMTHRHYNSTYLILHFLLWLILQMNACSCVRITAMKSDTLAASVMTTIVPHQCSVKVLAVRSMMVDSRPKG